jgi:hypothetical protein
MSMSELIEILAGLSEDEQLELCDALVDDPRLRDLLETIDDSEPLNMQPERELN